MTEIQRVRSWTWPLIRAIVAAAIFAGWMYLEWQDVGNATPLFGAFHLVTDGSEVDAHLGVWMCAFLIPCILSYPFKPSWLTAALSGLGLVLWLMIGVLMGVLVFCSRC